MSNQNDDLNKVLDALSSSKNDSKNIMKTISEEKELIMSDSELFNEIVQMLKDCIETNKEVMISAKELADSVGEAAFFEAYASVSKSTSDMMKVYMSLVLENKKIAHNNKMKDKDTQAKKELLKMKMEHNPALTDGKDENGAGNTYNQTNLIINANVDDLFKSLYGKDEEKVKAQAKIADLNGIAIEGEKVNS